MPLKQETAGIQKANEKESKAGLIQGSIGDDLFELRHVGKLNTRVLYFFMKGQRIILVHGIRSKAGSIPARHRKVALERMRDWLERSSV